MQCIPPEKLLEAAHEQIAQELKDLLNLSTNASQEDVLFSVARLVEDEGFAGEVRDRLEHGENPLLARLWSDTQDEDKEPIYSWLRSVAWPLERPRKPWERYESYGGDEKHYREALYCGERSWVAESLPSLAEEWLDELVRVGYHGVDELSGPLAKERRDESAISRPAGDGEAYPVFFEKTRDVLWLIPDGPRDLDYGHRRITVSDEPLRIDKAILAALVALEVRPAEDKTRVESLVRGALSKLKLPLDRPMWEQVQAARENLPKRSLLGREICP